MTRFIFLLLLVASVPLAYGEVVEWSIGKTVDLPIKVSLPTKPQPRTIILPAGPVTEIPSFWFPDQMEVKWIRNTVIVYLKDPVFSGTLPVYDDKGNLFLFTVHADKGGQIDDTLILKPAADPAHAPDGGGSAAIDTDGGTTEMMVGMVSGHPTETITGAIQYRTVDGKLVIGKRIFEDDTMSWYLTKVWQGPRLRGYETLMLYRGKKPARLNAQRIWFPGALAVYASSQVVLNPQSPEIDVQPNQAIKLFFVVE